MDSLSPAWTPVESERVLGGRFRVESRAGAGGMGTVLRARDQRDNSLVAIKLMVGANPAYVERFALEVDILANLCHPGIVRYVTHGVTAEDVPYVVMEWLEGSDLTAVLGRRRLSLTESIAVARGVAEALGAAHARGVIHRDVKPGNIFLVGDDVHRVKLIDFGIARVAQAAQRLTRTDVIVGTPAYMAPEQLQADSALGPAVDVFSLGCVLFECLTGSPAFDGLDMMARLARILMEEPPSVRPSRPDAPPLLDRLLARMLSKRPSDRPADGLAVAVELGKITAQLEPCSITPASALTATMVAEGFGEERETVPSLTRVEQRLVTVVLTGTPADLVGWDEEAIDVASELRRAVAPYGGRVDALSAGPLLVTVWEGESAVERAERAANCALALRARFPDLPVALTTGRGRVVAMLVEGDVIDQALHALRCTPGGLVRVDAVTADMLRGRFNVEDRGDDRFLREERSLEDGATLLLGKPSACVGRSRELSVLEGLFRGCTEESVATASLVVGPTGSGKSRLARELVARIRGRGEAVTILTGRGSGPAPFGILADAIRRAADIFEGDAPAARHDKLAARIGRHLEAPRRANVVAFLSAMAGSPLPDAGEAFQAAAASAMLMGDSMRAAWEDWIAAETAAQPVLLLLEDLQLGDPATVGLVDATLRNLQDRPLMVLALARPEMYDHFPSLWADREVQVLKLGPLPRRACERLVSDALGPAAEAVMDRILERAAGNPFYLEELIRAVAAGRIEAFPDSVLGSVEARLDAEGGEAKRVLRAASVFGERFSRDGVAALLGGSASRAEVGDRLDRLVSREIIAPVGPPPSSGNLDYVFRHALVREAAHAMLTEGDRALGHRLAGEWLELGGHADPMAIAEHFRLGGAPDRAIVWYERAASQALAANDLTGALDRVALCASMGAEGEALARLGVTEAEAHLWRGELTLAEDRSREVTALFRPGTIDWFRAVTHAATAAGKLGAFDRVEAWIAPATSIGAAEDARSAAVVCFALIATQLTFGGRYAAADAALAELTRLAADPARIEPRAIAELHNVRAVRATVAGDLGAGLDGFRAALAVFEQMGDHRQAAAVRSNIGFVLGELGDPAGAEEALRGALAAAERMGLYDLTNASLHNLGRVVAQRGRIEEARALEQRALDAYVAQGDPRMAGSARAYLAQIAVLAGDFAEAEREAEAAAEALRAAPPLRASALSILARARLALGRKGEALAAASEAFAELTALGSLEEGEAMVRLVYAEALAAVHADGAFVDAAICARARLLDRASRISDPVWREQFLRGVPENARTLALLEDRPGATSAARGP